MALTAAQRFWHKVIPAPDGCWIWTGQLRDNGYGSFHIRPEGRWTMTTTHRWAYEDQVGPIPEGYEVDHLCRTRACVRPDHLEAVTLQENRKRRDIKYSPVVPRDARPVPVVAPPEPKPKAERPPRPRGFIGPKPPPVKPTHCKNGHEYAVVGRVSNGKNMTCAECRRIQYAAKLKGGRHGTETHCPKGHPYAGENLYLRPNGGRECRACVLTRNRAAYYRRRDEKRSQA